MEKSPEAFRTISEVADWLGVPTHVLRFWESRFSQIRPVKRAGGRRYYRPRDMLLLGGIRKLLHDDGMTIRGVQKMLREEGVRRVCALSPPITGDTGEPPAEEAEVAGSAEIIDVTAQLPPESPTVRAAQAARRNGESGDEAAGEAAGAGPPDPAAGAAEPPASAPLPAAGSGQEADSAVPAAPMALDVAEERPDNIHRLKDAAGADAQAAAPPDASPDASPAAEAEAEAAEQPGQAAPRPVSPPQAAPPQAGGDAQRPGSDPGAGTGDADLLPPEDGQRPPRPLPEGADAERPVTGYQAALALGRGEAPENPPPDARPDARPDAPAPEPEPGSAASPTAADAPAPPSGELPASATGTEGEVQRSAAAPDSAPPLPLPGIDENPPDADDAAAPAQPAGAEPDAAAILRTLRTTRAGNLAMLSQTERQSLRLLHARLLRLRETMGAPPPAPPPG